MLITSKKFDLQIYWLLLYLSIDFYCICLLTPTVFVHVCLWSFKQHIFTISLTKIPQDLRLSWHLTAGSSIISQTAIQLRRLPNSLWSQDAPFGLYNMDTDSSPDKYVPSPNTDVCNIVKQDFYTNSVYKISRSVQCLNTNLMVHSIEKKSHINHQIPRTITIQEGFLYLSLIFSTQMNVS